MKVTLKTTIISAIVGLITLGGCATPPSRPGEALVPATPGLSATPVAMEKDTTCDTNSELPEFISVVGEIKEIYERGYLFVLVETWEEEPRKINFIIDQDTILLSDRDLEVGMSVIGHYRTNVITPTMYPPQIHAIIFKSQELPGGVLIDRFDGDWNAFSRPYQLEIQEDIEIVLQDGNPFEGDLLELENRALIIFFDAIPRVVEPPIPVVPTKIIVLFEIAVPPIHYLTEEELDMMLIPDNWQGGLQLSPEDLVEFWASNFDPKTAQILVNDECIESPAPFVCNESGQIMVPVAPIAQALGYNVYGEGADVVIGPGITFTAGVDSYFVGRMAPVQLFAAPILQDNVLFVPMGFFQYVLHHSAYIMDGNVIIRTLADDTFE